MKRIIVVGVTSSGKSTLAKKLSDILGHSYIQLDELFWKPNWTQSSDEEFFAKIQNEVKKEFWILDGNYFRSNHLTWPLADTVIWIDLPFYQTLFQNIWRSVKRAIIRNEIWKATGNKESFSRMFSKDSIIRWLLKTYEPQKKRNEQIIKEGKYPNIKFYRLKSRKQVNDFYKNVVKIIQ